MRSKRDYLKLRQTWAPENIRLIIIAESPPADGRYFYDVNGSWRESLFVELIIQLFGVVPKSKEAGLRALRHWGVLLLDATYTPLHDLKLTARNQEVKAAIPVLIQELESIKNVRQIPIILIKKNVCELLEGPLVDANFRVVNEGKMVAFPGSGQQANFRKVFAKILTENLYAPDQKLVNQALKNRLARPRKLVK